MQLHMSKSLSAFVCIRCVRVGSAEQFRFVCLHRDRFGSTLSLQPGTSVHSRYCTSKNVIYGIILRFSF